MDESVKTIALDLEKQSTKLKIKGIEPTSRSRITVVIVDRKFSIAAELKDDSKPTITEAVGITTYSTSKPTVLSYVSMFESFFKLTELYEKSQAELRDTTDELEAMKKYLNDVIEEVSKYKMKSGEV
jgi:hypothetical protein